MFYPSKGLLITVLCSVTGKHFESIAFDMQTIPEYANEAVTSRGDVWPLFEHARTTFPWKETPTHCSEVQARVNETSWTDLRRHYRSLLSKRERRGARCHAVWSRDRMAARKREPSLSGCGTRALQDNNTARALEFNSSWCARTPRESSGSSSFYFCVSAPGGFLTFECIVSQARFLWRILGFLSRCQHGRGWTK